jgi:hypothetical protein
MNLDVFPLTAEMLGQYCATKIARQLHATAKTSSRTK